MGVSAMDIASMKSLNLANPFHFRSKVSLFRPFTLLHFKPAIPFPSLTSPRLSPLCSLSNPPLLSFSAYSLNSVFWVSLNVVVVVYMLVITSLVNSFVSCQCITELVSQFQPFRLVVRTSSYIYIVECNYVTSVFIFLSKVQHFSVSKSTHIVLVLTFLSCTFLDSFSH